MCLCAICTHIEKEYKAIEKTPNTEPQSIVTLQKLCVGNRMGLALSVYVYLTKFNEKEMSNDDDNDFSFIAYTMIFNALTKSYKHSDHYEINKKKTSS